MHLALRLKGIYFSSPGVADRAIFESVAKERFGNVLLPSDGSENSLRKLQGKCIKWIHIHNNSLFYAHSQFTYARLGALLPGCIVRLIGQRSLYGRIVSRWPDIDKNYKKIIKIKYIYKLNIKYININLN